MRAYHYQHSATILYCDIVTLDLEWYLYEKGIVKDTELEDDPKLSRTNVKKSTLSMGSVFRVSGMDSDED